MAKKDEPKDIRVTRIDCEEEGVKSRITYFVTETYARESLGLTQPWLNGVPRE